MRQIVTIVCSVVAGVCGICSMCNPQEVTIPQIGLLGLTLLVASLGNIVSAIEYINEHYE